jgi:hypothetical protein
MVVARAGSKLVRSGIKGAKRLWDDATGSVQKVRAATGTKGQPGGVGTSAKGRRKGRKQQSSIPARQARKSESKTTTDLTQPAGGSAGRTIDQADAGIPSSKKAAKSATDFDKTIKATKEKLDIQKDTLKKLQKSLKAYGKGKNLPLRKRIKELKEKIELNQAKLTGPKGMVSRGGPRVNRKTGGQVMKKAAGGKMSRVGLSPAEESRSGTMSEAKRKKYKHGGKIHHNTSRENRLEELGRVDAEKAYTPQGKRNLKDEKKRIVRGLKKGGPVTGDDFVAQYYEITTKHKA